MRWILFLPLVLLQFKAVTQDQSAKMPDADFADVQKNVEYEKVGELSIKLDIFSPKDRPKTPLPVIVWFHGGGWNSGAKEWNPWREAMFVQHGYCFVSVDYRLSTVAPFPAQVEDCKCAVRWIRKNAQQYGIDPDRIGAWGYSAGGHLALMVGCADEKAGLEGKGGNETVSSAVQAVCSWAGPADLREFPKGLGATAVKQLCGGTPAEKPDVFERASPITYAGRKNPPIMLIHGENDDLVSIAQIQTLAKRLEESGTKLKFIRVKNCGHSMPSPRQEPAVDALKQAVLDFFDSELKAAPRK